MSHAQEWSDRAIERAVEIAQKLADVLDEHHGDEADIPQRTWEQIKLALMESVSAGFRLGAAAAAAQMLEAGFDVELEGGDPAGVPPDFDYIFRAEDETE